MKYLLSILGAALFVGCSTTASNTESRALRVGMTKAEVRQQYGEPTRVSSGSAGDVWYYNNVNSLLPLTFQPVKSLSVTYGKDGRVSDYVNNGY